MTIQQEFQRVEELFHRALELPQEERGPFLERSCGQDPRVRERVERLLRRDGAVTGGPLEELRPGGSALRDERFRPGDLFAGRYQIVSRLGRGGAGEVYRARDLTLDVQVALKVLRVESPAQRERLLNEVRLARAVTHPTVCRVYDVGTDQGDCYLTMEYVEGEDLASLLRRIGRLPAPKALEIARELCTGLAAAHAKGILHRDLKPANILIDADGHARIVDFGIALHRDSSEGDPQRVGTPAYMAPEQLGLGGGVGEHTDCYALGLVLYEATTGRRVFDPEHWDELLVLHRELVPEPPSRSVPDLDPRLERCILQALSQDPAGRPPSAGAMAAALEVPEVVAEPRAAERRQLTVMFCDLVGYTELSSALDPEDLREVVRAYQEAAAGVIERLDGHVAQYLGDGVLAYFGYPTAHEDDPERAVRAGLGVVEALDLRSSVLEAEYGVRLEARVGLHTGPVVVGEVGSQAKSESLALGETANLAARLQAIADPGTVVASAATVSVAPGVFVAEELEPRRLKGFAEPVRAFRVLEVSGMRGRLEAAAARGLTPLVGRGEEIGLLLNRWQQVLDGTGQAVLVSGEAGIGKSRLLLAFRESLADVDHTWLECRCSPYTKDSAFWPVIEMQQQELGFAPKDTVEEKLAKLEWAAEQGGLAADEVVPLFAPLHSIPLPGRFAARNLTRQGRRRKTLEALVDWLLRMGRRQPVVLAIEDLHWIDPSSLEFLGRILEEAPTARLLMVATHRPDFRPPWPPRSHVAPLLVNRLTRDQTRELIDAVASHGAVLNPAAEEIARKTDGVPLFVEEVTRAFVEATVRDQDGGLHEGSGSDLPIPATLQDSLMARLDRLGTAKDVAQLAATLGREFSYEVLFAIASSDEPTLREGLDRLVEAEVLYRRGVPPDVSYQFKHALIQEAAYQSLLKSRRRVFHERIARAFEERFTEVAERQPELVAHHYTEAGRKEIAKDYWIRAGQRANERSASLEAIHHFERALDVLGSLPETPERTRDELALRIQLGIALTATQGFGGEGVGLNLIRARTLCRELGDPPQLFRILYGLWGFHMGRADREATPELARELMRIAETAEDPDLLRRAHLAVGATSVYAGRHVAGCESLAKAAALFDPQRDRLGLNDPALLAHVYEAAAVMSMGFLDRCAEVAKRVSSWAEKLDHPHAFAQSHFVSLLGCHARGELSESDEWAEKCHAVSREQVFPNWLGLSTMFRGARQVEEGRVSDGIDLFREGLSIYRATGNRMTVPHMYGLFADALVRRRAAREARRAVEEATELERSTLNDWSAPGLARIEGDLLVLEGAPPDAIEASYRRALAIAQRQDAKFFELRAAMSLARLWHGAGRRDAARELVAPLYGWFTEGLETPTMRRAKATLDELS